MAENVYLTYPVQGRPIGTTAPYMPQAMQDQSFGAVAPLAIQPSGGYAAEFAFILIHFVSLILFFTSSRIQEYTGGSSTYKSGGSEDHTSDHPAGVKPINLQTQRATSSVTEIPGAIEGHKKISRPADFKNPGKPLRSGSLATDRNATAKQPVVMEASEVSNLSPNPAKHKPCSDATHKQRCAPTRKNQSFSLKYTQHATVADSSSDTHHHRATARQRCPLKRAPKPHSKPTAQHRLPQRPRRQH